MESDSVLAAGTAAAGGQSDDEEAINQSDDIGQMFDEPSSPAAADEPPAHTEIVEEEEEVEPVPATSFAPVQSPPLPKKVNKIKCFVAGCLHRHRAAVNASFHKWPKNDPQTKSAWISACGRQ